MRRLHGAVHSALPISLVSRTSSAMLDVHRLSSAMFRPTDVLLRAKASSSASRASRQGKSQTRSTKATRILSVPPAQRKTAAAKSSRRVAPRTNGDGSRPSLLHDFASLRNVKEDVPFQSEAQLQKFFTQEPNVRCVVVTKVGDASRGRLRCTVMAAGGTQRELDPVSQRTGVGSNKVEAMENSNNDGDENEPDATGNVVVASSRPTPLKHFLLDKADEWLQRQAALLGIQETPYLVPTVTNGVDPTGRSTVTVFVNLVMGCTSVTGEAVALSFKDALTESLEAAFVEANLPPPPRDHHAAPNPSSSSHDYSVATSLWRKVPDMRFTVSRDSGSNSDTTESVRVFFGLGDDAHGRNSFVALPATFAAYYLAVLKNGAQTFASSPSSESQNELVVPSVTDIFAEYPCLFHGQERSSVRRFLKRLVAFYFGSEDMIVWKSRFDEYWCTHVELWLELPAGNPLSSRQETRTNVALCVATGKGPTRNEARNCAVEAFLALKPFGDVVRSQQLEFGLTSVSGSCHATAGSAVGSAAAVGSGPPYERGLALQLRYQLQQQQRSLEILQERLVGPDGILNLWCTKLFARNSDAVKQSSDGLRKGESNSKKEGASELLAEAFDEQKKRSEQVALFNAIQTHFSAQVGKTFLDKAGGALEQHQLRRVTVRNCHDGEAIITKLQKTPLPDTHPFLNGSENKAKISPNPLDME